MRTNVSKGEVDCFHPIIWSWGRLGLLFGFLNKTNFAEDQQSNGRLIDLKKRAQGKDI